MSASIIDSAIASVASCSGTCAWLASLPRRSHTQVVTVSAPDRRPEHFSGIVSTNLSGRADLDTQTCYVGDPVTLSIVFEGDMRTESMRIDSIRLMSKEQEEDLLITYGKKEPEIDMTPPPQEVEGADVEELDPDASE